MKVVIAGSRNITDYDLLLKTIADSGFEITEVVSGGAKGVDAMGERYARENNIPLTIFKAEWSKYGKGAGPVRNKQMAEYGDALIALMVTDSKGTKNMVIQATKLGLQLHTEVLV